MLELVIERAGKEVVSFPVGARELRVGRAPTNDISLPEPTISRNQFRILQQDGKYFLVDTSGRGTEIDGKIVSRAELLPGLQINLGSLRAFCREVQAASAVQVTTVGGATQQLPGDGGGSRQLFLVCSAKKRQKKIPLAGASIGIGSNEGNDLVLQDDFVSGFHCRLVHKKGAWFVTDLNSTNGTRLNGILVGEARLEPGAIITLGTTELRIECPGDDTTPVFEGMVSRDPIMKPVFDTIRQVAPTDEPVLVTGESGTGKELVAQAIHRLSRRAARPLVAINCAAISKELIESELFGHEKGAFTGAQNTRPGLFEEAEGGTLFLDEIGELQIDLQAKLLRAIENREIRRVGSNKNIPVDVRIVAATHRPLPELVRDRRFREDLFFRICVIEVNLPPLRKRRSDITLLAEHFLAEVTRNTTPKKFSPPALEKLNEYRFPGNVRELKHIVTRATILCPETEIGPPHLIFSPPTLADRVAESRAYYQNKTLQEIEEDAVRTVMESCEGNQRAAARILGLARSTLTNKLRRYRINIPDQSGVKR